MSELHQSKNMRLANIWTPYTSKQVCNWFRICDKLKLSTIDR